MTRFGRIGALVVAAVVAPLGVVDAQQPTISDIATCNEAARARAGNPSASPGQTPTLRPPPRTQTDPSGSVVVQSPDPLLEGMATEGLNDEAYKAAYRECMAGRLKLGR